MGLTLKTQPREGELRASRCSLGVARSPLHAIFPIHRKANANVNNGILWIPVIYGGIVYIGLLGLFGVWNFPRNNFPRFQELEPSGQ